MLEEICTPEILNTDILDQENLEENFVEPLLAKSRVGVLSSKEKYFFELAIAHSMRFEFGRLFRAGVSRERILDELRRLEPLECAMA